MLVKVLDKLMCGVVRCMFFFLMMLMVVGVFSLDMVCGVVVIIMVCLLGVLVVWRIGEKVRGNKRVG